MAGEAGLERLEKEDLDREAVRVVSGVGTGLNNICNPGLEQPPVSGRRA